MTAKRFPEYPACAYSLVPPMWVGGRPGGGTGPISASNAGVLTQEVFRKKLKVGIEVSVRRASAFYFDFSGWSPGAGIETVGSPSAEAIVPIMLNRVAVLNTHLACLYTKLYRNERHAPSKQVIAGPRDLIELDGIDPACPDQRIGITSATSSLTSILVAGAYQQSLLTPHYSIRPATVEQSLDALDEVLQHPAQYALLLSDLLLRGCQAFEDQNNSLALTISWTIIEKLLRRMWTDYIHANRERPVSGQLTSFINKARREKLEGHDYTASVVAEILSLVGALEPTLYADIEIVRRARNHWLHGLELPTAAQAELSIDIAQRMLLAVEAIDYELRVFQVHSYSSGLNPRPPDDLPEEEVHTE